MNKIICRLSEWLFVKAHHGEKGAYRECGFLCEITYYLDKSSNFLDKLKRRQ